MNRHRAGAWAWILSAVLLPIQVVVALSWPNGYSWSRNAISDLGVTSCGEFSELGQQIREVCSPAHAIFNVGMIVSGSLVLLGSILLYGYWDRLAGRVGVACMALVGVSIIGVGVSPWDVSPAIHDGFALVQAAAQWLAMALIAFAAGPGWLRRLTIIVLFVSFVGFTVFVAALDGYDVPWIGLGGVERLSFDSLTIWTALTGAALLVAISRSGASRHAMPNHLRDEARGRSAKPLAVRDH